MKRIFEFQCASGHITERLMDDRERICVCDECDKSAVRVVSAPRINLEGFTGAFPGAYSAWERKRAEKLKQERRAANA